MKRLHLLGSGLLLSSDTLKTAEALRFHSSLTVPTLGLLVASWYGQT